MQLTLDFDVVRRRIAPPQNRPVKRRIRSGLHCDARLSELARTLACQVKSYSIGSKATVWWNPRLRTTAGTAEVARSRIDLNPRLVSLGEEVVDRILRHELAHLVAADRNRHRRIAPHGKEWKQACADLGIPGESASHSLPIGADKPRYAYRCPSCLEVVHRQRRMASGSACYACCKKYNGGEYSSEFVFERVAVKPTVVK